eukprot:scaffold6979_cov60-Phaeocystis_antarctica.AAC.3
MHRHTLRARATHRPDVLQRYGSLASQNHQDAGDAVRGTALATAAVAPAATAVAQPAAAVAQPAAAAAAASVLAAAAHAARTTGVAPAPDLAGHQPAARGGRLFPLRVPVRGRHLCPRMEVHARQKRLRGVRACHACQGDDHQL